MKPIIFLQFLLVASQFIGWAQVVPNQPWFPVAPVLEVEANRVVAVATVEEFMRAVANAMPGDLIELEDGIYYLPRYVEISTDHVTVHSQSGNREKVILDGSQSMHGELLGFRSCTGVTVADLTIQNIMWNGFKINSDDNVQDLTIYNCIIHNIWQRGVKSVKVPLENYDDIRPLNSKIQYCLFYNDRPKRFSDDTADTPDNFNGNYIGGIDTMHAKGWTISDNVFIGIQGRTREGRGSIFMWHHAEDCVIERNIIINCDVGIALGNSSGIGEGQSSVHGTNMIVRNNFISQTPETGIFVAYTKDCHILNNTIYDPQNRMNRLMRIVHDNQNLTVINNLLSGPGLSMETNDDVNFENNLIGDFGKFFIDPNEGDLHITIDAEGIIDQGIPNERVSDDIDQEIRDLIDIGADEFVPEETSVD